MGSYSSFEEVWEDILTVASKKKAKGEPIYTLARKVPNEILSVDEEAIVVRSERNYRSGPNGQPRTLRKDQFQAFWDKLAAERRVTGQQFFEQLPWAVDEKKGRIIMAFIGHLPRVEVEYRPKTTLILMPHDTHPLGTLRERGESKARDSLRLRAYGRVRPTSPMRKSRPRT